MDRLMEEWIQKTKKDLQIFAGLLIINSVAEPEQISKHFLEDLERLTALDLPKNVVD